MDNLNKKESTPPLSQPVNIAAPTAEELKVATKEIAEKARIRKQLSRGSQSVEKKDEDRESLKNRMDLFRANETEKATEKRRASDQFWTAQSRMNETEEATEKRSASDQSWTGQTRKDNAEDLKENINGRIVSFSPTLTNLLSCNTALYLLGSGEQAKAICYYMFDYLLNDC